MVRPTPVVACGSAGMTHPGLKRGPFQIIQLHRAVHPSCGDWRTPGHYPCRRVDIVGANVHDIMTNGSEVRLTVPSVITHVNPGPRQ